jgi:hypothetical protein
MSCGFTILRDLYNTSSRVMVPPDHWLHPRDAAHEIIVTKHAFDVPTSIVQNNFPSPTSLHYR